MKQMGETSRHLDARATLDYLESRLDGAERRRVEAHLGSPCERCHALVGELGWLVARMESDRVPDLQARVLERAIGLFEAPATAAGLHATALQFARLLLDSWDHPLPAGGHRAVGQIRRLRLALGDDVLELETEIESAGTRVLRGRLKAADPSVHRVEVLVGREHRSVRPDAGGWFVLDRIPLGPAHITVSKPGHSYRIPTLE